MFTNLRDNPVFWLLMRRSLRLRRFPVYVGWILLYTGLISMLWLTHLPPTSGVSIPSAVLLMSIFFGYSIVFGMAVGNSVNAWRKFLDAGILNDLRGTPILGKDLIAGVGLWVTVVVAAVVGASVCLIMVMQFGMWATGRASSPFGSVWALLLLFAANQICCGFGISFLALRFAAARTWELGWYLDGPIYASWAFGSYISGILLSSGAFLLLVPTLGDTFWIQVFALIIPALIHLYLGRRALVHAAQSYDREDWVPKA